MTVNLPNDILNDTDADAVQVQQNFQVLESYVNTELVDRNGSVAMLNPLLLPGPPAATNQAATKGYVDSLNTSQKSYIDTQDAKRVATAGDAMTGNLGMGDNYITGLHDPTVATHAANKGYVDTQDAKRVSVNGDTMTGDLVLGNSPSAGAGIRLGANPPIQFAMASNTPGQPSMVIRRGTSADANGERFIRFEKGDPPGTIIGRIEVASASTVAYMTSSGAALKERVGEADDALDRVSQLGSQVYRGTWVGDDGTEWDLLNAEDVQSVAPYLVSGEGDEIALNLPGLVPMLLAAVSQLATRVAALEAAS